MSAVAVESCILILDGRADFLGERQTRRGHSYNDAPFMRRVAATYLFNRGSIYIYTSSNFFFPRCVKEKTKAFEKSQGKHLCARLVT